MHVLQDTLLWLSSSAFKHLLASFVAPCTSKAQLQLCNPHLSGNCTQATYNAYMAFSIHTAESVMPLPEGLAALLEYSSRSQMHP